MCSSTALRSDEGNEKQRPGTHPLAVAWFGSGNVSGFPSMSSDLQKMQNGLGATLEEKWRGPWGLSSAGGGGWRAGLRVLTGTADPSPWPTSSEVPKTPLVPQEQVRNYPKPTVHSRKERFSSRVLAIG